jgi:WD40 repeat protein
LQDVVTEYKVFEGHEEDILSMAMFVEKSILATGDYEGRICIWNMNSGEKKMSLFHRSDRHALPALSRHLLLQSLPVAVYMDW